MDDKIKEVMDSIAYYADARIEGWSGEPLLNAIESKLRELVQVPPGYALVPVEPTKAMIEAAEEAYMPFGAMELAYAAMLSAAPKVGH